MFRSLWFAGVVAVGAVAGCTSGGRSALDSQGQDARGIAVPTTEQVRNAAPVLAGALNDWRVKQRANERLVVRGPTFVGLEGASAPETGAMETAFAEAINQHSDPRLRFVPANVGGEDGDTADSVLDARASWEPATRRAPRRRPRLVLEVIDPTTGKTVFSADCSVAPPVTTRIAQGSGPQRMPTNPESTVARPPAKEGSVAQRPPSGPGVNAAEPPALAKKAVPSETSAEEAPPVAPPASERPRASLPRDRDANRVTRSGRSVPARPVSPPLRPDQRGRSPVLFLQHGVIYFTDQGLAERVILLQERAAVIAGGDLSVRFVMTSRKGKKTLELRCDFYDAQGAAAGSVESVELPIREGAPATIALASRKPAVGYVLFVRD